MARGLEGKDRRARIGFGAANLAIALFVAFGVFRLLPTRWWLVDGGAVDRRRPARGRPGSRSSASSSAAERLTRVAAAVVLALGLALFAAIALTASWISGVYAQVGIDRRDRLRARRRARASVRRRPAGGRARVDRPTRAVRGGPSTSRSEAPVEGATKKRTRRALGASLGALRFSCWSSSASVFGSASALASPARRGGRRRRELVEGWQARRAPGLPGGDRGDSASRPMPNPDFAVVTETVVGRGPALAAPAPLHPRARAGARRRGGDARRQGRLRDGRRPDEPRRPTTARICGSEASFGWGTHLAPTVVSILAEQLGVPAAEVAANARPRAGPLHAEDDAPARVRRAPRPRTAPGTRRGSRSEVAGRDRRRRSRRARSSSTASPRPRPTSRATVDDQGSFRYLVDAPTNLTIPGYNWPRHAGATFFLAQAAAALDDPYLRYAALRAASRLRDSTMRDCGEHRCIGADEPVVEIGSSALALIAFTEIVKTGADPAYRPAIDGARRVPPEPATPRRRADASLRPDDEEAARRPVPLFHRRSRARARAHPRDHRATRAISTPRVARSRGSPARGGASSAVATTSARSTGPARRSPSSGSALPTKRRSPSARGGTSTKGASSRMPTIRRSTPRARSASARSSLRGSRRHRAGARPPARSRRSSSARSRPADRRGTRSSSS